MVSQDFGLRGCQEHYTMNVEDFMLNKDDNHNDFVTFTKKKTIKTRQGSLRAQAKSVRTTQNVRNG